MDLVIATGNSGKLREITQRFSGNAGISFLTLNDYPGMPLPEENGSTFEENALLKARAIADQTGKAALADDSGLSVAALGGRPGVFSARYGTPDLDDRGRCLLLLEEMTGIPAGRREGWFTCALALVLPGQDPVITEGRVDGTITFTLQGAGGFGYDPIFFLPAYGKTMAEIGGELKNQISHRARALDLMLPVLENLSRHG